MIACHTPFRMQVVSFVLACLTFAGHGYRAPRVVQRNWGRSDEDPLRSIAELLLAFNPVNPVSGGESSYSRRHGHVAMEAPTREKLKEVLLVGMQANSLSPNWKPVGRVEHVPGGTILDTEAMLATSTFNIKPDKLIELTKQVLAKGIGVLDNSVLADDFEFCAPFVGPIKKDEYIQALEQFDLLTAFPDMNNRFYNLHVDPFEFNRVWWFTRATATHTGPLLGKPPTNKYLELPPQANSFTFNEEGKVTQVTVGYVMDRRVGNTGGLGGAFAYFYGIGSPLPVPECYPYKRSFRFRALNWMAQLQQWIKREKDDKDALTNIERVEGPQFAPGMRVILRGLKQRAEMNGRTGVCDREAKEEAKGLWDITLDSGKAFRVAAENMMPLPNSGKQDVEAPASIYSPAPAISAPVAPAPMPAPASIYSPAPAISAPVAPAPLPARAPPAMDTKMDINFGSFDTDWGNAFEKKNHMPAPAPIYSPAPAISAPVAPAPMPARAPPAMDTKMDINFGSFDTKMPAPAPIYSPAPAISAPVAPAPMPARAPPAMDTKMDVNFGSFDTDFVNAFEKKNQMPAPAPIYSPAPAVSAPVAPAPMPAPAPSYSPASRPATPAPTPEWLILKAGPEVSMLGMGIDPPPQFRVVSVVPDGWAARQGIVVNAEIREVNGERTENMDMERLASVLKIRPVDIVVHLPSATSQAPAANLGSWGVGDFFKKDGRTYRVERFTDAESFHGTEIQTGAQSGLVYKHEVNERWSGSPASAPQVRPPAAVPAPAPVAAPVAAPVTAPVARPGSPWGMGDFFRHSGRVYRVVSEYEQGGFKGEEVDTGKLSSILYKYEVQEQWKA